MKNRYSFCIISLIMVLSMLSLSGCGGGAGSSSAPQGETPGVAFKVKLTPSQSIAQTNASILLRAKVLDGNGAPIANIPVTFTNLSEPFGVMKSVLQFIGVSKPKTTLSAKVVNTDVNGIAQVSISSTVSGFATVQAEVNNGVELVRDKRLILFSDTFNLPAISVSPQLSLDVDTTSSFTSPNEPNDFILFKTSGDTQRYIRATVFFDTSNSGKIIVFGSDSADVKYPNGANEISVVANSSGQATVLATVNPSALSQTVKTINITAFAADGASSVLTLLLEPVVINASASSLVASTTPPTTPPSVLVNGTATITATVRINTGGFAPDGTSVNFTSTCGAVGAFAQTTDGVATATFTAPATVPSGGVCTVTGKVAGVTIGSASITIKAGLTITLDKLNVIGITNPDTNTSDNVTFTVAGGVPPYVVETSNSALTPGGSWSLATSGSSATTDVNNVGTTTLATFTVHDNAGATATATLSIFPQSTSNTLTISLDKLNVIGLANPEAAPSDSDNVTLTVTGGVPPYMVTSNTPAVTPGGPWPLLTSGSTALTDVNNVGATTAVTFTVRDNVGTTANSPVLNVFAQSTSNALTIALDKLNVIGLVNPDGNNSDDVSFTVTGGTPPYVVTSSTPTVTPGSPWPLATSGSTALTDVSNVGSTTAVTFTVRDNAGTTATSPTLNIFAQSTSNELTIALDKLNVIGRANPDADSADNVTFTVTGGVPPYVVTSSNAAVTPGGPWALSTSGSSATSDANAVGATTGVTFSVRDNVGTTVNSPILNIFAQANTNALTVALDKLNVIGLGNPDANTTDDVTMTVTGGVPPYTITSDNPALTPNGTWSLPTSGSTAVTDVNNVGAKASAIFTVRDNAGTTATSSTLNIFPQTTGLVISVNKPDVIGLNNTGVCGGAPPLDAGTADDITVTVTGGTAPYIVSAADENGSFCANGPWTTIVASGGTVVIDPDDVTSSKAIILTVTDSAGAVATTTVTIRP
ncbi:MAG TPA: hypothetical protein VN328_06870 [Thermodesulfovibrionales bacterium]|nr:hypothetical protein [Thermodesulfovibrionales bacterium]